MCQCVWTCLCVKEAWLDLVKLDLQQEDKQQQQQSLGTHRGEAALSVQSLDTTISLELSL